VERALLFHHGVRYYLAAWVVMPHHVHALIRVHPDSGLSQIVHTWKSFTAIQILREIRSEPPFWAPDYFDHLIRNEHQSTGLS